MSWVKQEQDSLVETFRTTDPDAPTLCEGWDVRRLLAHLTQREHSLVVHQATSSASNFTEQKTWPRPGAPWSWLS